MKEPEKQLWAAYQADRTEENRNALVTHYQPYLRHIAVKVGHTLPPNANYDIDDLVNYGFFGLLQAIDKFEPERGLNFTTFAPLRITGAIRDGLRNEDWVPRLERVKQARGEVEPVLMKSFESFRYRNRSQIDDGDDSAECDPGEEGHAADRMEFNDLLRAVMRGFSKIERLIFIGYHVEGQRMHEIGRDLNLSESRISQMHSDLMVRVRARYGKRGERVFDMRPDARIIKMPTVMPKRVRKPRPVRQAVDMAADVLDVAYRQTLPMLAIEQAHESTAEVDFHQPVSERTGDYMDNLINMLAEARAEDVRAAIEKKQAELASLEIILKAVEARGGKVSEPGPAIAPRPPTEKIRSTKAEVDAIVEKITAHLREHGPMNCADLARAFGVGYNTMVGYLQRPEFRRGDDFKWAPVDVAGVVAQAG